MAQYLPILYAILALGGLGILFVVVLGLADKKFAVEVDERVSAVRAVVAGANCGACGYAGCDAYAAAVVRGAAAATACTPHWTRQASAALSGNCTSLPQGGRIMALLTVRRCCSTGPVWRCAPLSVLRIFSIPPLWGR